MNISFKEEIEISDSDKRGIIITAIFFVSFSIYPFLLVFGMLNNLKPDMTYFII